MLEVEDWFKEVFDRAKLNPDPEPNINPKPYPNWFKEIFSGAKALEVAGFNEIKVIAKCVNAGDATIKQQEIEDNVKNHYFLYSQKSVFIDFCSLIESLIEQNKFSDEGKPIIYLEILL